MVLVAIGLGVTFASSRDQDHNQRAQIDIAQRSRWDAEFSSAESRLIGEDDLTRFAGVLAIEALMKESSYYEDRAIQELCLFVRTKGHNEATTVEPPHTRRHEAEILRPAASRPPDDVLEAIRVLVHRPDPARHARLDLHNTPLGLIGADLDGANLDSADLDGANLDGAHLNGAHLDGAQLREARMAGAHLVGAHLVGANLHGADLAGADLAGADLTGAKLVSADLTGVVWTGAVVAGADLGFADPSRSTGP